MNWKQRLFKPKWQHKDVEIRLHAVTNEQDPLFMSNLVQIAGTDSDKRVRCAAIKRLHQLANILPLYDHETDSETRELLENRIRQLTAVSDETRPSLELRLQVLARTSDRKLIEHLSSHAPETQLRRAALAKVTRQGLLGDCCIQDPDSDNRQFAASRITQHTTLKRVIDGLRKRDKALYTQLQTRLHQELLQQSDKTAIQREALHICTSLEHIAIETDKKPVQTTDDLHLAWQAIAANVTTEMIQRYDRICDRLAAPKPVATAEPVAVPDVAVEATEEAEVAEATTPPAAKKPQPNKELEKVATAICLYEADSDDDPDENKVRQLESRLEKTWKQCDPPHPDDLVCRDQADLAIRSLNELLKQNQEELQRDLTDAQALMTKFELELEQGSMHKALQTRTRVHAISRDYHGHNAWKQIQNRLSETHGRLRELREWQHWSNDKIRKRLIAEMEILPAADLHPDALLDRVKSLQDEWKSLEKSEQIPGEKHYASAAWMWQKFSSAGHAAFATAKPYLEKRTEIQSRHAQSLATFCAELELLAEKQPQDWTALGKAMTRGRKKLHDLNSIPARQRQALARKLKSALDKANKSLQDHYKAVEKEKMKLIRSASQLIHLPERADAIALAKSLQSNWKDAGSLWRSKEQDLWNQFREHLDPLFKELKEQQASIRAVDAERLGVQKALCNSMKDILASGVDLQPQHGIVQGLQDSWKDIEHIDRGLQASFQSMLTDYQQKVENVQQIQANADRDRWWQKSILLHEFTVNGRTAKGSVSKTAQTKLVKAWPTVSSDSTLEIALDDSFQNTQAGEAIDIVADDQENQMADARLLCIRLEFIAGLQSPDEDRDQRMQYQVDRLAESMSGDSERRPVLEEAHEAESEWLRMFALSEPEFSQFGKRIKQALAAIVENT